MHGDFKWDFMVIYRDLIGCSSNLIGFNGDHVSVGDLHGTRCVLKEIRG